MKSIIQSFVVTVRSIVPAPWLAVCACILCLPDFAHAENPGTKFAWKDSRIELAITLEEGNDHEFRFVLLETGDFPTVYSGIARGPAAGTLVFQESAPADGRKPVRIEFLIDGRKVTVRASPIDAPHGTVPELSGSYGIVTRKARLTQAQDTHLQADRRLNELYQSVRTPLAPADVTRLRSEQQQWIDHRDQMAGWHAAADGAGDQPAASVEYWRWMAALTRARCEMLAIWDGKTAAPGLDGEYSDGFGGLLSIADSGPDSLGFTLSVVRGPTAHTGEITGTAKRNGARATFTDADLPADQRGDPPCEMDFSIIGKRIEITSRNSQFYHGARAYFNGTYYKLPAVAKGASAPESADSATPDEMEACALDHLDRIADALEGYRDLTEWLRKNHTVTEDDLQKHTGTDRETQNLGFRNWPAALRLAILTQQDQLADLRLQLAMARNAPGDQIQELRSKATRARTALETFRKDFRPQAD